MQGQETISPAISISVQRETDTVFAENQFCHICPVIFALILPILLGLSRHSVPLLFPDMFYAFIFVVPAVAIIRLVYDWLVKSESFVINLFRILRPLEYKKNLPLSVVAKSDLRKLYLPRVTLMLVICNTVIYYSIPEEILKGYVFTPVGNPSLPEILVSVFTSVFLHSSTSHLFGNMLFLSIFGSFVESKIGSTRFLIAFFLCEMASTIIFLVLLKSKWPDTGLMSILKNIHTLGASGAIAGIMGLFVVRCFFARFMLCSPFLSMPFLSIPFGLPAALLASSFFALDVSGSLTMYQSEPEINYWSHLGGYLGGFALGYCLKLHRDASRESLDAKSEILTKKKAYRKGGQLHEAALKFLLDLYKYDRKKGEFYYACLIQVLVRNNFQKAIDIFLAYYPNYVKTLPGDTLWSIGLHFYSTGDFKKAGECLKLAADMKGPWQVNSKLYLAMTSGHLKGAAHHERRISCFNNQ